ncbi:hypothetical protein QFZ64_006696 [Streptomyces sp. B3I8]|nr:hypothetical protein [Streptomyces sp. B3I8]
MTTVQLREVVERLVAAGRWKQGDPNVLVVLDAGHDAPRIAHLLGDLLVEIMGRLRSEPGDAPAEALARGVRPVRYGPGRRI